MKKHRVVNVSESELEDLVRQGSDLIEEGLKFVDHQAFTPRGPLDVLFVDSGKAFVIAELKIVEDDGMLTQGIDYYDYVSRNLEGFARAYKRHKIDPRQNPRLFLIAPSFSVTLLNRIKWIDVAVSLFAYQCLELEGDDGVSTVVYTEVTPPGAPERVEEYSLEERYSYITDPESRELARKLVIDLRSWDDEQVTAEAIKYSISIKARGKVLGYLAPRRKFFLVQTNDDNGVWTDYRVTGRSDIDRAMGALRLNFERIVHPETA